MQPLPEVPWAKDRRPDGCLFVEGSRERFPSANDQYFWRSQSSFFDGAVSTSAVQSCVGSLSFGPEIHCILALERSLGASVPFY